MISYIKKVVSLLLATVMLVPSVISQGQQHLDEDCLEQQARIEQLEKAYKNAEYAPVCEDDFVDGNLESALDSSIKFNELSFVATHNSYQTQSIPAYREIFKNLSALTFGLVSEKTGGLDSQTLTDQFNCGIRSIELDIETISDKSGVSFRCIHSPVFDMTTNCYDLELALKEISLWSENNPNHLPITLIIEPKKVFIPLKNMKYFNLKYANELDNLLINTLGDRLFTPAQMLRDYESFEQMRFADDWCEVKDMLGKVLVLLHDTNATSDYINQDKSIKSQAMFPMLRYDDKNEPFASFLLINKPKEALEYSKEIIDDYKFIVRTQVDTYTSVSREKLEQSIASNAQILSTDYPVRTDLSGDDYFVSFNNKTTIKIKN